MMVYTNEEIVLQNKIIIEHSYIEDGLKFIERETFIPSSKKRCDILFEDKTGIKLYVEVKEVVDDKAIEQINEYRDLVGKGKSRFMLLSNYPIHKDYQLKLNTLQIEYKNINKNDIEIYLKNVLEIPKGNSIYQTKENIIGKLGKNSRIANEIYKYVANNLHSLNTPIICNISDGIMFQVVQCNEKFLSISARVNRLLFHFPNGNRDKIFDKYKNLVPEIQRHKDKFLLDEKKKDKEPNQIDIKLKHVKSLEYVKPLIDEAFKEALKNQ